jgi:hypothetical protein
MTKRKHHEIIQNIEHKHCGKCDKWKTLDKFGKCKRNWDGKRLCCKSCVNKKKKQRRKVALEKRKQARENAPTGFLVCLDASCTIKGLQTVDQFINPYVRNNTLTKICLACRKMSKKKKNQSKGLQACQEIWDLWRKKNKCIECSKNSNYKHNYLVIEADHLPEFKKVKPCSSVIFWCAKSRGVPALKAELIKCQALCRFHHEIQSQQRRHDNGRIQKRQPRLKRLAVIRAEKHKRGCCKLCKRVVKEGEECAFSFDHRDPTTKFMYNGKAVHPSRFPKLPDSIFNTQWPLEQAKCDLLCKNCDKLKTFAFRDGYK